MRNHSALLLLGPTGSGKTPFGEYLEANGLYGRRCFHFDFGRELRSVAERNMPPINCTQEDVDYIHKVLKEGALLENETFYIANNILQSFIEDNGIVVDDLVVLNGLPRHVGQAEDVDAIISMKLVILLECSPEVVYERIQLNSGGDRSGRVDDSLADIKGKLMIFTKKTLPLVQYYSDKGIPVKGIPVTEKTRSEDMERSLR
jgi:adenylate kinase family enzyme